MSRKPAPWHEERMCVFDLETTSPEPAEARIVTAAIGWVGGGELTAVDCFVADAGVEVPEEAAAIHGYTTERVREEGALLADVVDFVVATLASAVIRRLPVVVFNAPFDLTVLRCEADRLGPAAQEQLAVVLQHILVVDPLVIDRHLDRYRRGKRNLEAQCEHYRAKLEGAHDATYDAVAAGRLAWVLAQRGQVVRSPRSPEEEEEAERLREQWERIRHDLPALHDAQREWYRAYAARLEQVFRQGDSRKGVPPDPDRVVSREWPA